MSDSGYVFRTETLKNKVFSLRAKYRSFFESIKDIPHLKIPIETNLETLKTEALTITEWLPVKIESKFWSEYDIKIFGSKNLGRALVEFVRDSNYMTDTNSENRPEHLCQFDNEGQLQYFPTDLLETLPEIKKLIYSVGSTPSRCRIMKTGGKYNIPWHSHHGNNKNNGPYFFGVVQIPIVSKNVDYGVRSFHKDDRKEYFETYTEGQAYLFNSYHEHCVINNEDEARISLFLTFNLENEKFIQKLLPLVEQYRGPLLERPREYRDS